MQRALMQFRSPKNQPLVRKALRLAGREDLIGRDHECLVPPESMRTTGNRVSKPYSQNKTAARQKPSSEKKTPVKRSSKWAKAKPKKR